MAAEGAFQHVEFGAQQVDLGAEVVFHGDAGDDGEMRKPLVARADQEGLHAFGEHLGRDGHADGEVALAARDGGDGHAGQRLFEVQHLDPGRGGARAGEHAFPDPGADARLRELEPFGHVRSPPLACGRW